MLQSFSIFVTSNSIFSSNSPFQTPFLLHFPFAFLDPWAFIKCHNLNNYALIQQLWSYFLWTRWQWVYFFCYKMRSFVAFGIVRNKKYLQFAAIILRSQTHNTAIKRLSKKWWIFILSHFCDDQIIPMYLCFQFHIPRFNWFSDGIWSGSHFYNKNLSKLIRILTSNWFYRIFNQNTMLLWIMLCLAFYIFYHI